MAVSERKIIRKIVAVHHIHEIWGRGAPRFVIVLMVYWHSFSNN